MDNFIKGSKYVNTQNNEEMIIKSLEKLVIDMQTQQERISKLEKTVLDMKDSLKKIRNVQNDLNMIRSQLTDHRNQLHSLDLDVRAPEELKQWMLDESVKNAVDHQMTPGEIAEGFRGYAKRAMGI